MLSGTNVVYNKSCLEKMLFRKNVGEIDTRGQFHEHKLGGKIPPGEICPKFGGKEKFRQVKNSNFTGKK